MSLLRNLLALAAILLTVAATTAQEAPKPDPTVEALRLEIAELRKQIPQQTAEEREARARQTLEDSFRTLREQSAPPCFKAKGDEFHVTISGSTVTRTCVWKR